MTDDLIGFLRARLDEENRDVRYLAEHSILWREIGWLADGDTAYDELPVCGMCVSKHAHYSSRADVPEGPCLTVRALALPYADHPDYRPEWRP